MWKIDRGPDSECRVLRLSGRIQGDHLTELGSFLEAESNGERLVLDLAGVKLVDHEVVSFLANRESCRNQIAQLPSVYSRMD